VERDLAALPASGQFLEEIHEREQVSVRGVFPLLDVNQKVIGGVFVEHDISPLYQALAAQRSNALLTIGVLLLVLGVALAMILRTLVFRRLEATMNAATRVVGGDFETPIVVTSDDEVGRLEALLESFRQVFVTTVSDYEQQLTTSSERLARGVSGTGPVASSADAESGQKAATR
jgi:signal transduction histidine kinase